MGRSWRSIELLEKGDEDIELRKTQGVLTPLTIRSSDHVP